MDFVNALYFGPRMFIINNIHFSYDIIEDDSTLKTEQAIGIQINQDSNKLDHFNTQSIALLISFLSSHDEKDIETPRYTALILSKLALSAKNKIAIHNAQGIEALLR